MSRYFPHTPYAEDQPLYHTILVTHTLSRGAAMGAMFGAGVFGARALFAGGGKAAAATAAKSAAAATTAPAVIRLLRASGTGTVWGTAIMALALAGRMRGREEIEWRDRAWRLLENKGQLETDDFMVSGAAGGLAAATAVAAASRGGLGSGVRMLGVRGLLGAAGSGSLVGLVGYMSWKYGAQKGERSL